MTKASGGLRHRTRHRLKKAHRQKLRIRDYLQEFSPDEKVVISIDPSSHKGMPHPRFKGKIGVVKERRGRAYRCEIMVGTKRKEIIARPEHLRPLAKG